jgi:hypothetical protein
VTGLSDDDLRRARVAAQLLHRPGRRPAVADLVARLLAVQAQDIGASPLALRVRSRGLTAADVAAAREDRSVVRAWGPRTTLHLMTPDDVPLLLLCVTTSHSVRRLRQEGITGSPDELTRTVERALAGQGPLIKAEVGQRLGRLGTRAEGQGIVHTLLLGAAQGTVVLGPDRGNKPTYVHAGDWFGRVLRPARDRDRAVAEIARRYVRAHGPAAPEDLAAWSGLAVGEARAGWAAIADELTEVAHAGRPLWRLRRAPRPGDVTLALLPAFDEYVLGWRDRAFAVAAPAARLFARGGGMIPATVLADGRVVGTWRRDRSGGVVTDLFEPVDEQALAAESEDLSRFASGQRSSAATTAG